MTAEIAVMNRHAIAIAADSAITVSSYNPNTKKHEERYFKGANKIFQLSAFEPVGLMIFDMANFEGMPWEIIVKQYRDQLGKSSFVDLKSYGLDLFKFIEEDIKMYPSTDRVEFTCNHLVGIANVLLYLQAFKEKESDNLIAALANASTEEETKSLLSKLKIKIDGFLQKTLDGLNALETPAILKDKDLNDLILWANTNAKEKMAHEFSDIPFVHILDMDLLCKTAVTALYKQFFVFLPKTGVVISGYGKDDFFPGFVEFSCHGLFLDTLLYSVDDEVHIGKDAESFIRPFAQSQMTDTFVLGFSSDIFNIAEESHQTATKNFLDKIKAALPGVAIPNENDLLKQCSEIHKNNWNKKAITKHATPLRQVISSLPIDEMANLCETFIMLESLKERVTRPTEQVGGPVDVAVITKGDGFVWVKRKHYFPPELNTRYFHRLGIKYP